MKFRIFNLFVLLVLLASMLFVQPSTQVHAATTWTVTTTSDSNDGSCSASLCSLRDAVIAANADSGDFIAFAGGVTGTITLGSSLTISSSMTITGPGSGSLAVSGNDSVRVLYIQNSANVSISSLTISHGKVIDDYGGAIYNAGTLALDHVIVTNNQALNSTQYGFGGGIGNYGTLTITNSTLSYNTAQFEGGAIYNYFGAGLSMTNVIVDHNQALTGGGGGLSIRGIASGQPVALDNVSITNNSSADYGGGMYSDDSLAITNSLLANNTSAGWDGGLFIDDSGGGVPPVTITLTNITVTGNSAASGAGGMHFTLTQAASSVTLNNATVANNQISGTSGSGGITASGSGITNVENTIIAGNTSSGTSTANDCSGTINSQDYNLIQTTSGCTINGTTTHNVTGVSAGLSALAQNDGFTETMALQWNSPAVDAGNPATPGSGGNSCAALDQRGHTRPKDGNGDGTAVCDIGAFELDNDDFNTPKTVSTLPYSDSEDTEGFTIAPDDQAMVLSPCNSDSGLASAWYSFTPSAAQTYTLDTFGSNYNTVMTVWTGSRGSLSAVACNDNASGATSQSALTVNLSAGITYYIEIIQFRYTAYAPTPVGGGMLNFHVIPSNSNARSDLNGDGKADLAGFGSNGVYVALSTGTGFGPATLWTSGFSYQNGWTSQNTYPRMLADVNGDGKADAVGFGSNGVYVALSTGTGFSPATLWTSGFSYQNGWTSQNTYPRSLGHIDGSNNAALVGFGSNGVYVALSTGTGFGPATLWTSGFSYQNGWTSQDAYPRMSTP